MALKSRASFLVFILTATATLSPGIAKAIVIPEDSGDPLESLAFVSEKLRTQTVAEPFEDVESVVEPEVRDGWASFRAGQRGEWRAHVDTRNGRIDFAEGAGIPWVPGHGNGLTRQDVATYLNAKGGIDLGSLEKIARGFLPRVAHLLGINPSSLVLNRGRSGKQADYLWYVDFDIQRGGLPIEGARVVFRVNNGNLIQFGTENLPATNVPTPRGKLQREAALARLTDFIGSFQAGDIFLDNGSLRLITVAREDPGFAKGFRFGDGRGLAAVWQFTFRRDGSHATWHARVDADSGEILELKDVNRYASANGVVKIFDDPSTFPKPMPFTNTGLALPNNYTNSAGVYNYPGGVATSTLNGLYVRASDACGITSLAADTSGNFKFGTTSGTDCTTPGFGGAGNTTASRTQFYLLNRAKEVARGWLPGNEWLESQLTANVNMNATCNAFWNGITVNFYRSGGGCGNTGEIEAISLHEYGHGLDANDGNFDFFTDNATGETYGDFTAALATQRSCIGPGFHTTNCGGYGDACTSCTGVRDINWSSHTSNTPHTVANFTQTRCPTHATYLGPCGREGHCESYVSSEALWDFVARDQPYAPASWAVAERLWYLSRPTATEAFTCNPSGTWTSDGCNTGSLWRTLRAVDDDDGNLSNGTPHGGALFAAFNRHGIACTTDAGASTTFRGCFRPAVPTLTVTGGINSATATWTSSGTGVVYDVYRGERNLIKIVDDTSGTSFSEDGLANDIRYGYQVVAHPLGNEACAADPTGNRSTVPCIPPPAGLAASAAGPTQINLSWNAVADATSYVVYRSTTSGGPYTQIASGITGTTFSSTGLSCGTTYFYVVRGKMSQCESANSTQTSATTATTVIPAPTGLTATTTGQPQINLFWNTVAGATSYNVYRSPTSGGPYTQIASGITGTTFSNTGLSCSTTHYYVVRAVSSAGCESANSNQASAATPTTVTAAPTGLTATAVGGQTQINLSWNAVAGAASYKVYRSTSSGGSYTQIASGVTGTAFSNTSLSCGTYYYFVRASSGAGCESADSNMASALATTMPTPTGLVAVAASPTQIDLSWNAVAGATSYYLESSSTSGGLYSGQGSATGTTYAATNLWCGQTRFYAVQSVAGGCRSANSIPASATTPALPTPTGLTAVAAGQTQINLSWNAVAGVTTYDVYRRFTSGGSYTKIASNVPGTTFSATGLSCGMTYFYFVRAVVNSFCESANSNEASATTETTMPAPTGLTAAAGPAQIDLSWNAVTGASSYYVYRSTTSGGPYGLLTNVTATTVSSTNLSCGQTYFYTVRAHTSVDGCFSADSNQVSATPPVDIAAPTGLTAATGQSQINLSWNTVAGATSYNVYRSTTSGGSYTKIASNVPGTTFSNTSLSCSTAYYYFVRAVSSAGCESADSNQASAAMPTTVTAAPTGLTAAAVAGQTKINLSWNAVTGAASYNVYRSDTNRVFSKIPNDVTGTTFSNTGLSCGTYFYFVRAVSSTGCESADSNEASALATTMPTPTGLTAATAGQTQIDLSWNAVSGAFTHLIYRSTTSGGPFSQINTRPGATFSDFYNLSCGTTYFYVVRAYQEVGRCFSADSNQASATTVAMMAPTGLTAAAAGQTQINLSWKSVAGATSYNVYRSTTSGGTYNLIGSATNTTFSNTGLTSNTTYFYFVQAVATGCQSGDSNQASATTMATASPATTSGSIPARPTGATTDSSSPAVPLTSFQQKDRTALNSSLPGAGGRIEPIVSNPVRPSLPRFPTRIRFRLTGVRIEPDSGRSQSDCGRYRPTPVGSE